MSNNPSNHQPVPQGTDQEKPESAGQQRGAVPQGTTAETPHAITSFHIPMVDSTSPDTGISPESTASNRQPVPQGTDQEKPESAGQQRGAVPQGTTAETPHAITSFHIPMVDSTSPDTGISPESTASNRQPVPQGTDQPGKQPPSAPLEADSKTQAPRDITQRAVQGMAFSVPMMDNGSNGENTESLQTQEKAPAGQKTAHAVPQGTEQTTTEPAYSSNTTLYNAGNAVPQGADATESDKNAASFSPAAPQGTGQNEKNGAALAGPGAESAAKTESITPSAVSPVPQGTGGLVELPIEFIRPDPNQPRKHFNEAALEELAQSIAAVGILQPIIVTKEGHNQYLILAGERRWRAAQRARLHSVPVIIRDIDPKDRVLAATAENTARDDLNPLEEAAAFRRMAEQGMSHREIAETVGRSKPVVTGYMRLLDLPREIQDYISSGKLGAGHARALLPLFPQAPDEGFPLIQSRELGMTLARKMARGALTKNKAEKQVSRFIKSLKDKGQRAGLQDGAETGQGDSQDQAASIYAEKIRGLIVENTGVDAELGISGTGQNKMYRITLTCYSLDELDGIVARLCPRVNLDEV